jgi:hypothetical protein
MAAGIGYATVADLLAAMSPVKQLKKGDDDVVEADDDSTIIPEMIELTQVDLATKLQSLGIGEQLLAELVMVASKVNYGQLASQLHSLVGSVSLAGIQVQKKVKRCGSGFNEFGYGSGSSISSESGYGSRVLMTKNCRIKNTAENCLNLFLVKNCGLLILGLQKGRPSCRRLFSPQKRTSITSKNEIY